MVSYIEQFAYVFKHKYSTSNRITDTLNRKTILLVSLSNEVVGFEYKDLCAKDNDFKDDWEKHLTR